MAVGEYLWLPSIAARQPQGTSYRGLGLGLSSAAPGRYDFMDLAALRHYVTHHPRAPLRKVARRLSSHLPFLTTSLIGSLTVILLTHTHLGQQSSSLFSHTIVCNATNGLGPSRRSALGLPCLAAGTDAREDVLIERERERSLTSPEPPASSLSSLTPLLHLPSAISQRTVPYLPYRTVSIRIVHSNSKHVR